MGEYYIWANVDKMEYINPYYFDLGNKLIESSRLNNPLLAALQALLDDEWKGDRILFMGDESLLPDNSKIEIINKMRSQEVAFNVCHEN